MTVEDHMVAGGFGSAVLELLESHGLLQSVEVRLVGFPDRLIEHGAPSILKELYGLTSITYQGCGTGISGGRIKRL